MKVAVVGKGGVGKTTLTAALARRQAQLGRPVVAVDADPDGNLASALGVALADMPEPIALMKDLIRERTDSKNEGGGLMFKINPKVDDLPERFSVKVAGINLLVLGTVEHGGKGCLCPETALLKALMQHLLLRISDDVLLDMEAGLEHVGRASAKGVDAMIAVVEPGMRSVQTAMRVHRLAKDIGIDKTFVVANKISRPQQSKALALALPGQTILGTLPYCEELGEADLDGRPADIENGEFRAAVDNIAEKLQEQLNHSDT
jgi:CO dehydrogenase maturation factor